MGAVLRGSRLYVLLVARTFTTGASLVLIKVRPVQTVTVSNRPVLEMRP